MKGEDEKVDWVLAEGWNIQFDKLYNIFIMKAGNIESEKIFGKKLEEMGLIISTRDTQERGGERERVIIGIRSISASIVKKD